MTNCTECGAPGPACETRFNEFLVLEFTEAGFGAVHHLTVAAFVLQHSSKLSREGWLQMRELLREFLLENKPPAFIRNQNKGIVDSGKRKFKIKSRDALPVIHKNTWTKTILDVPFDDRHTYCSGINEWAMTALKEAEELEV
jgi:hypothetical protein